MRTFFRIRSVTIEKREIVEEYFGKHCISLNVRATFSILTLLDGVFFSTFSFQLRVDKSKKFVASKLLL
jgi:hypothetical protein